MGELMSSFFNYYPVITPVRLAVFFSLPGQYYNGPTHNGVGATIVIDPSVPVPIGNPYFTIGTRLLLPRQNNANENGVYEVSELAVNIGQRNILRRTSDFNCIEQLKEGQLIIVANPDSGYSHFYVVANPLPDTFGVDDLVLKVAGPMFGKTEPWVGGSLFNIFDAPGLGDDCIVVATIFDSTNIASIVRVQPNNNSIFVTFTADPGPGTIIAWSATVDPPALATFF